MSLKEYIKQEISKLKELSFKKRIEYIWEYYKVWIIATFISLILIIGIITTIVGNSSKDSILYAVFLNSQMVEEDQTILNKDFIKYAGFEDSGAHLTLDTSLTINRETNDMFSLNAHQKLITLLAAQSIDTIVSDEDNFLVLADGGGYISLDEVLSPEFMEEHQASFYYTKSNKDSQKRPYGIYLNSSQPLKKDGFYLDNERPIFGIPLNTENTKTAVLFLEFLLN